MNGGELKTARDKSIGESSLADIALPRAEGTTNPPPPPGGSKWGVIIYIHPLHHGPPPLAISDGHETFRPSPDNDF